jgi:hypothetical protein
MRWINLTFIFSHLLNKSDNAVRNELGYNQTTSWDLMLNIWDIKKLPLTPTLI